MAPLVKDAAAFLAALADTPELWRSVNLRVVAIWTNSGWQNLAATAHLDSRDVRDVAPDRALPRLQQLAVFQHIFPVELLPALIQRLRLRGNANIDGTIIHFLRSENDLAFSKPYTSAYRRLGLSLSDYVRGEFEFGHVLMMSGDSSQYLFREFPGGQHGVTAALRRAGWQGLDELLLRGLGDVLRLSSDTGSRIVFVAPLPVSLVADGCVLEGGELRYSVVAGTRAAARRAVLTIAGEDNNRRRIARDLPLERKRWGRRNDVLGTTGKIKFPSARSLNVTLHVAGYELGHLTLINEPRKPARIPLLKLAHDQLFAGERAFTDVLLEPEMHEGRLFERAVAKLFGYCGFPGDQPGKVPQEQNGPDVLVEVRERNLLLVIETTVAHLINDEDKKMNRLTKRAANLRVALQDHRATVVPVMVVPWSGKTLVPVELEEAQKNGVRILCREDLEALLEMALTGIGPGEIACYVVPEQPVQAPKRFRGYAERNPLAE